MYHPDANSPNSDFDLYKERLTNFSNEFELGLFIHIARKNVIWLFLFLAIGLVSAFLYLRYTLPIYESSSIIQIKSKNTASNILKMETIEEGRELSADIEIMRSKIFLERILNTLPFEIGYYNEGELLEYETFLSSAYSVHFEPADQSSKSFPNARFYPDFNNLNTNKITLNFQIQNESFSFSFHKNDTLKTELGTFYFVILDEAQLISDANSNKVFFTLNNIRTLVNKYRPRITYKILNEYANTVGIEVKDYNPTKAAALANALSYGYIQYSLEKEIESSNQILEFIDKQIQIVFGQLKDSESSILEFKVDNKLNQTEDFTTIMLDRLSVLEEELIDLTLQENVLKEIKLAIQKESDKVALLDLLPALTGNQFDVNIKMQITELQNLLFQREQELFDFSVNSGNIKSIDQRIDLQQRLLMESIKSFAAKIAAKKENVNRKIVEFEKGFKDLPIKELSYARLQRIFSINEKFYTLLLEKKAEYSIAKAGIVPENIILEEASSNSIPVSPQSSLIYAIAILLAIILSIVIIIAKYLFYNQITSLNEIVKLTHASVGTLGIVPRYPSNIPVSQLIVDKKPKSVISESFRAIRTNLQFIDSGTDSKIIAITSTISGEGKTFVAINLGGIIAFSNKKVIILDLDMRKPKIHKGFGSSNDVGMSTLLIGKSTIAECTKKSTLENLDFITAGPTPPNPAELIINGKLEEILAELKKTYSTIIIDNPPVGLVTDGIYCLQIADYPIYIFRSEYSKRNFVQNLDRIINENNIRRLSVILNNADLQSSAYSYNYSYGYGYGYSSSYGNDGYYTDSPDPKKAFSLKNLFKK